MDAREVAVVGDMLKGLKNPPPARVGHKGGGGGGRQVETSKKSTSCSCLDVKEVVVMADAWKIEKRPPGLRLDAREVVIVAEV